MQAAHAQFSSERPGSPIGGPNTIPVPRLPGVQLGMNELQQGVEELGQKIDALRSRLDALCLPAGPNHPNQGDSPANRPVTSQAAERLQTIFLRVRQNIDAVDDLNRRLDI